jgi:3-dehydroquinate synthetase
MRFGERHDRWNCTAIYWRCITAENFDTTISGSLPGEQTKDFDNLKKLYAFLRDCGLSAQILWICCSGGGVITRASRDYAAATYLRALIMCRFRDLVGTGWRSGRGETAINLKAAEKPGGGLFWQPKEVLSDISLLKTLQTERFAGGMAELSIRSYRWFGF